MSCSRAPALLVLLATLAAAPVRAAPPTTAQWRADIDQLAALQRLGAERPAAPLATPR